MSDTRRRPRKPKRTAGEEAWSLLLAVYFGEGHKGIFGVIDDYEAFLKLAGQVIKRHVDEIPDDLANRLIAKQRAQDAAEQEKLSRQLPGPDIVDAAPAHAPHA